MFASIEKKLIEKNYKENLLNGYLFAYQNKKDQLKNITLDKFMEIGIDKRKRFEMWLQYSKALSNTSYVYL